MSELIAVTDSPFGKPVDVQYDVWQGCNGEEIMLLDVLLGNEVLDAAWLSGWVAARLTAAVEDARAALAASASKEYSSYWR